MNTKVSNSAAEPWPALPLESWIDTYQTLHMWTQIVGKVRLALSPRVNHWWEVPLYVNAVGLTTSPIPYPAGIFEMQFDFIRHQLCIETDHETQAIVELRPRSVADFYHAVMTSLNVLAIDVKIWTMPCEVPNPIPFDRDTEHASYDPEYAHRFWRVLVHCDSVFKEFRARFIGKASPSHFFWGSFDLAVTRFSGRRAPAREGADSITREAYSHEVISSGWWPGGNGINGPAFYTYAAPEPEGFSRQTIRPKKAFYDSNLNEFLLKYDDVRLSSSPRETLLNFMQSTYVAGATLGNWNRKELERNF